MENDHYAAYETLPYTNKKSDTRLHGALFVWHIIKIQGSTSAMTLPALIFHRETLAGR